MNSLKKYSQKKTILKFSLQKYKSYQNDSGSAFTVHC